MYKPHFELVILYEHPEWHQPLFDELDKQGVRFTAIDLKNGATTFESIPDADLYYNMVSPSAYKRGSQHAIPFARALCNMLAYKNKRVLNGAPSNELEFSKTAQVGLLASIGANHPKTIAFNNVEALNQRKDLAFPMILKPEQGGSGARIFLIHSMDELNQLLTLQPGIWQPDYLLLLQEKLDYDPDFGIVRVEFINKKFLYAMRVVTHGTFNLCPSVVCNPEDGTNGHCEVPAQPVARPGFFPYSEITQGEKDEVTRVFRASQHDIGSVEYVLTKDGRQVFYDINANSNLRASIGEVWNVQPFKEVVNFLKEAIAVTAWK